jgi:serine/threonine protein phosphatase PrpC
MKIHAAGKTDVGRKRDHNEDAITLAPDLSLYIVCDGMGGHAGGEVASAAAIETVERIIRENQERLAKFDDTNAARDGLLRLVEDAIQQASAEVYRIATSSSGKAGMGTTLTLVLCTRTIGVMGHVGDSRLYLRRAGRTYQLSEDHTYVAELVKRGMTTMEQAKKGPYANVITRAVGIQHSVRADTLAFDILPGDTLLLCSDGLSKYLESNDELGTFLDAENFEGAPAQLVDLANHRGGADNISAVVLRAVGEDGDDLGDSGRTTEVNLKLDCLRHVMLFRHLDMSELCKVLSVMRALELSGGEVVMREGETSDALYAIIEGLIDIDRGGAIVRTLQRGEHFGEMALFNSRPRSATVTCRTKTRLLIVERSRFNELLKKEPQLGVKLLWSFAQVLSLRLDDATGLLYGSAGSNNFDTEITSPFKPPAQP